MITKYTLKTCVLGQAVENIPLWRLVLPGEGLTNVFYGIRLLTTTGCDEFRRPETSDNFPRGQFTWSTKVDKKNNLKFQSLTVVIKESHQYFLIFVRTAQKISTIGGVDIRIYHQHIILIFELHPIFAHSRTWELGLEKDILNINILFACKISLTTQTTFAITFSRI